MSQNLQALDSSLLAKVQDSIAQILITTEARENNLAALLQENGDRQVKESVLACQKRIQGLETLTVSIAGKLTGVDMVLAKEEDYLSAHLAAARDLRRRLEEWAGRAIG